MVSVVKTIAAPHYSIFIMMSEVTCISSQSSFAALCKGEKWNCNKRLNCVQDKCEMCVCLTISSCGEMMAEL